MVCVPCVAIPILLIIWRFLIQPLFTKWCQFRNKQKGSTNNEQQPQLITECRNGVCTLTWKKDLDNTKID